MIESHITVSDWWSNQLSVLDSLQLDSTCTESGKENFSEVFGFCFRVL